MCKIDIDVDKKRSEEMKNDREVMDVLKYVFDGKCADDDLVPQAF
jgi:hypothetical protein